MAKKRVFKKKSAGQFYFGFYWFFWVLLILSLPITGFYWVILGFFSFLNKFWANIDFNPFELFLILALLITRFYDLLWGLIGLYWVFSLFLMILGLFKKNPKKSAWWGF